MVQNIRPPQDFYVAQHQHENNQKSIRGSDNSVAAVRSVSAPGPAPTQEQVEQAAARVKDVLQGSTSRVEFDIDPDLNKVVVRILSGESGEVIRQIPSQELLDLAKQLDAPKGLLVRERA